jgi:fructokinase
LAFISLDEKGERSFSFFRRETSEYRLARRHIEAAFVTSAQVLQVGTNSLVLHEAREAALAAVGLMRGAGRVVSCDPNVRLHVWPSPDELKHLLRTLVPLCDVFKMSEEEISVVSGQRDVEGALKWLAELGVKIAVVTRGPHGAEALWNGQRLSVPAPVVEVVDTTGAGDGFQAGFLAGLLRADFWAKPSGEALRGALELGCRVGSLAVQRLGAIDGLPYEKSLQGD